MLISYSNDTTACAFQGNRCMLMKCSVWNGQACWSISNGVIREGTGQVWCLTMQQQLQLLAAALICNWCKLLIACVEWNAWTAAGM